MAEPHVTPVSEQPVADQRPAAQPLHLLAIGSGLALIVGAATNQAVTLSSQVLPQLPAPGVPILRVLVGTVGACVMLWGMWGLFGHALMRAARFRPWRRSPAAAALPVPTTPSASAVKPRVDVRLGCDSSVQVDIHSTVPNVSIGFEVISHHDEDAVLEKIAFQLWAGQPVLTATMDHRHAIPSHSTISNVFFRGDARRCGANSPGDGQESPTRQVHGSGHGLFHLARRPVRGPSHPPGAGHPADRLTPSGRVGSTQYTCAA